MSTSSSPTPTRDPLATLRIDRSQQTPTARSGKFTKAIIVLLFLLLISAGAGFGAMQMGWLSKEKGSLSEWFEVPDAIRPRPEVRVTRLVIESGRAADATVVATGYLESRRQAKIGARAPGRIEVVHVEEGTKVTKNEVLAVLEHADLDASLAATEASLLRARAAAGEQEIAILRNKQDFDRMKKLLASKSISDTEYEQAKFQYDGSVARLKSMAAEIQLAEARLREAQQLRENMSIRAPFDGTVISKDAEVGESILPGGMGEASGRGSVVTIADLDHLEVDCDVKEDYISRIASNQLVEVAVDAVPGKKYQGIVRKVIPMGDRARATIKVKVAIQDADEKLFPNMSSTVYFLPSQSPSEPVDEKPRMFLPQECIVDIEGTEHVWIVNREMHVELREVTTGKKKESRVEILTGLTKEDRIIVKPPKLTAKQPVKLMD